MPCAKALTRAKEPVPEYVRKRNPEPLLNHLSPDKGVILSVAYHPGYTPDLTSWMIQVNSDGEVHQAIQWYRGQRDEEELLDPSLLDPIQMKTLESLLTRFRSTDFGELERAATVDDAAMLSIVAPVQGIRADLPYFHFVHFMKKGMIKFDDKQKLSLSAFGEIWKFMDSNAPYSLNEHEKGRTKRRS